MFSIRSKIAVLICYLFFVFFLFVSPVLANNNADTNSSTISVNTGSIPADGATTATISITVKDSSGDLLSGDHVTLTSTADQGLIINSETMGTLSSTAATDSNGDVFFTVRSSNPGTDTFTASDTSDSPEVSLGSSGSVSVTFTPSSLAPSFCTDGAPGSTPQLTSAVANGNSQITLTWTDATDPVSYYLVSYGIKSGQYIYGNPNVGGQGTTSYTVNNLAKGTTYYFTVKAVNGCNPGSFSNELSATTTGGAIATPIPTSSVDTSSNIANQNVINPTDTPTPTQNAKPTAIPSPVPTQTAGLSKTRTLEYVILCIFIFGGIGIFISWKYNKGLKKPEIKNEDDQEKKDFIQEL